MLVRDARETVRELETAVSKFESVAQAISQFRENIPISKRLSRDAENFCSAIEQSLNINDFLEMFSSLRERAYDLEAMAQRLEKATEDAEDEARDLREELQDFRQDLARVLRDELLENSDAKLRPKIENLANELIASNSPLSEIMYRI